MIKKYKSIIFFGLLLAVVALLLQFFEYRYFVGSLDQEVYTSVVALIFTATGIWIGINILNRKKQSSKEHYEIDQNKIDQLKLNDREYEILKLISLGRSNKEISEELFIAVPTVKTHTSNLFSKLDVKSRTQAIHKAQSLHLI